MAYLRDLAGLAYLQASHKNYGLAADTSARFFEFTQQAANQTSQSNRKALEYLLINRDKITSELAKGDPGVLGDLQNLFLETRQNTRIVAGTVQP